MIFSSSEFLYFFVAVFIAHWGILRTVPETYRPVLRHLLLLAASYYFYMSWDARFIVLIVSSTLIDYVAGAYIARAEDRRKKRAALVVSICTNLGLLGIFKYTNFFLGNVNAASDWLGIPLELSANIVLPVGISFFTFQSMSYTIDIYRGTLRPANNFVQFALFVAFFPQLVAGPIVRAVQFLPQLAAPRVFTNANFKRGLSFFAMGLVKKSLISDWVSIPADALFADPTASGTLATWVGVLSYTIQIYCDFSGYSDMAVGAASMLGYRLPQNFDMPYLARNITEFWRKWHMTLSFWLRDYLYISLGGNRGTKLFTYRNLMLTMLLGGLWHGASWTFVVWGCLHGLGLVVHREFTRYFPQKEHEAGPGKLAKRTLATLLTFLFVAYAWVFFRATTFEAAWTIVQTMSTYTPSRGYDVPLSFTLPATATIIGHVLGLTLFHRVFADTTESRWWLPEGLALLLAIAAVILFSPSSEVQPFIYFQF